MTLQNVHGDPIFTKINKHKKQYEYLTKDIDTEVIRKEYGKNEVPYVEAEIVSDIE